MAIYLGNTPIAENVTIQQGGGVTIDDTLSDTSKNPVQNKVINAALNSKANLSDIPTTLPANGGNADTVDGKHASDFASVRKITTQAEVDGFLESGIYSVEDVPTVFGSVNSAYYMLIVNRHRIDANYNVELAIPYIDGRQQGVYYRNCAAGTWGTWTNVADGGNAATLETHPASDFALKTDIPTSLPANGGNSSTTNHQRNHYLGQSVDVLTYATSDNCPYNVNTKVRIMNSPTCPTNYGYNTADNDFWYDIYKLDNLWVQIKAYDVRGNAEFINSCCNGTWSGWVRCNDGGNAATLESHHASDFLYANGFAGQLAKLFSQPASGDELATLFSVVPDNASLDKLTPGIYVVNTSAARDSLGIPQKYSISSPPTGNSDSYIRMGGILIKFGSVFSSPNYYGGQGYGVYSNPVPFAFFIDSGGAMYRANCSVLKKGSSFTHDWEWSALVTDEFDLNHVIIDDIVYLPSDITIPAGGAYNMYSTRGMNQLPCKSGTAYGPSHYYGLTLNDSKNYLVIKNSGSSNMILPAGRYLITTR